MKKILAFIALICGFNLATAQDSIQVRITADYTNANTTTNQITGLKHARIMNMVNYRIINVENNQWKLGGNSGSNSYWFGTNNNFPLIFRTNNTERGRFSNGGLFGLGTASPAYLLDVDARALGGNPLRLQGLQVGTASTDSLLVLSNGVVRRIPNIEAFTTPINTSLSLKDIYFNTIDEMRAYGGGATKVSVLDSLNGGQFILIDGTSVNNGTLFSSVKVGKVWKRVHSKGIYYADWFNLKGDGVTDDLPALQTLASSVEENATIIFSNRTYFLNITNTATTIQFSNNIKIKGEGGLIKTSNSDNLNSLLTFRNTVIYIEGSNVTVENQNFQGLSLNLSTQSSIVSNCKFTNLYSTAISYNVVEQSVHTVKNCKFEGHIWTNGGYFAAIQRGGTNNQAKIKNLSVMDCDFKNLISAINMHNVEQANISNSKFEAISLNVLKIDSYNSICEVSNCYFDLNTQNSGSSNPNINANSLYLFFLQTGFNNVEFKNNTIKGNPRASGLSFFDGSMINSNINIEKNIFDNSKNSIVGLQGNSTVRNNTFINCDTSINVGNSTNYKRLLLIEHNIFSESNIVLGSNGALGTGRISIENNYFSNSSNYKVPISLLSYNISNPLNANIDYRINRNYFNILSDTAVNMQNGGDLKWYAYESENYFYNNIRKKMFVKNETVTVIDSAKSGTVALTNINFRGETYISSSQATGDITYMVDNYFKPQIGSKIILKGNSTYNATLSLNGLKVDNATTLSFKDREITLLKNTDSTYTRVTNTTTSNIDAWQQGGNTVTSAQNIGTISNYALPFITNNVERMRITESGNVGIGVNSTTNKLEILGTSSNKFLFNGTHVDIAPSISSAYARAFRIKNDVSGNISNATFGSYSDATNSIIYMSIPQSPNDESGFNAYDRYIGLHKNGNVGIGINATSAAAKLDVNPTINGLDPLRLRNLREGLTTDSILVSNLGTVKRFSIGRIAWALGGNSFTSLTNFGTTSSHDLPFITNNTEKARLTTSGQLGLGTSTPAASAILEVNSTTQGVLLPRLTTTQINAISSPAEGLEVWNTTLKAKCVYDGTQWLKLSHSTM